ncbi:MAG: sensor histidine kinase [Chitinophagaceae bacterium]
MKTKLTYLSFFALSLVGSASARSLSGPAAVENYTIAQKRLLIRSTAQFINLISQSNIDQDSVISMARQITQLPFLLQYTEGLDDRQSKSAGLINAGKITEAKQLLNTLRGEQRIQLLIELAIWFLHQPGTRKADLDSAAYYIRVASSAGVSQKLKNECQQQLGELYYQSGNTDESKKIYSSLFSSAAGEGDFRTMATASQQLGRLENNNDSLKLRYFDTALRLYQQLRIKEREIEVLFEISKIYLAKNNLLTQQYMLRVLDMEKSSGFKHLLYTQYILCHLSSLNSDFLGSLEYAKAALANLKWSAFKGLEPSFFNRTGAAYMAFGKNEEALSWFNKAIACRYTAPHVFWYKGLFFMMSLLSSLDRYNAAISLMDNITKEFPPLTRWEEMQVLTCKGLCYVKLHNYKLADENYALFYKLLTGITGVDPYHEFQEDLVDVVKFYISQTNIKKARQFMNLAFATPFIGSDDYNNSMRYQMLYKIDSLSGDYKSALKNHIKYNYYLDLVTNMDQRNKLDELTVKYAADKKDLDIKFLKQQGIVQQAELKQNKLTRNITLAAILLLLIIIALLFNQFLIKKKTNNAISKKNETLNKLLSEKEWLLKEVHHRVKNNLQTVVSLLELQSDFVNNEALSAIHDSQNRIFAMSLIHQKLYQSSNIASINMHSYLEELTGHLREIYSTGYQIKYNLEVIDADLDVSQAVPIGLIVNEAVTNSIKYAFTKISKNPEIRISLRTNINKQMELVITDNGTGFPLDLTGSANDGLGFRLMKGLAEDIEGEFTIESTKGTQIRVCFNANVPFHETNAVMITEKTNVA